MREQFTDSNFKPASLAQIDVANAILTEYEGQGFTLSLRQLYYQFVARGLIENTERSYKNLGGLITNARLAGLMDWDAIEDRNRSVDGWLINEDVAGIVRDMPRRFACDMWANQDVYVEVWVEKDALSSIVERACQKRRVPHLACKGYLSASEAYRAAKRFEAAGHAGKRLHLIHLGDHDPSGIDMTRDNQDRLNLMSWDDVRVYLIALNRDQVDHYNPPPNPAKLTDSRAEDYVSRHGYTSWELDALEPSVIVDLIDRAVERQVNDDVWEDDLNREREQKRLLRGVSEYWGEIKEVIARNREED